MRDRRASRPGCGRGSSARCVGVDVPLQAAEHYYLLTEPIAGVHRDLPVIEDPDRYGYYREEGGGLLVGLFEPVGAAVAARRARPPTSPSARCRPTGTG